MQFKNYREIKKTHMGLNKHVRGDESVEINILLKKVKR